MKTRALKKSLLTLVVGVSMLFASAALTSCEVARQAQGAYNMVNCKYEYQSLDDISVAGINVSRGVSLGDAPKVLNLLSGDASALPVGFVVTLGVSNPNQGEAQLNGMDYILSIDGIDFTSGSVDSRLSIPAGGRGTLPLAMAFDVAALLKSETRDAAANVVKNLVGLGDKPTEVALKIRPSFMVAGHKVTSPVYIPVPFQFGGKK